MSWPEYRNLPPEPYRCAGCGKLYETCPDHDAHDCPACGEKVMPEALFQRHHTHVERTASCDVEPRRASGAMVCETCGRTYQQHPLCFATRTRWAGAFLNVLCDGSHVKL